MLYKFNRFERSLMQKEYEELNLISPVEGALLLNKKASEIEEHLIELHIMTDQIPPDSVRIAAAAEALKGGYIKNNFQLREALSNFYYKYRDVKYNPKDEIFITTGSHLGLDSAFKLLIDPDDEVLLFEPDYATYEPMVKFYGGKTKTVPLIFNDNIWNFDYKQLSSKISRKTKMVILSNPNNPTGYMFRKEDLDFIVKLVQKTTVG